LFTIQGQFFDHKYKDGFVEWMSAKENLKFYTNHPDLTDVVEFQADQ
jgi:hypothetical protein